MKNIKIYFVLFLNFVLLSSSFGYLQQNWEIKNFDNWDYIDDISYVDDNEYVDTGFYNYSNDGFIYWNTQTLWNTPYSNTYQNNYYEYDYSDEYYKAIRHIDYNLNNCYSEKSIKFCEAEMSDYDNFYYNKYECYYNFDKKDTFCKFPFEKKKQYIWPEYWQDDYRKDIWFDNFYQVNEYYKYMYSNNYKYVYDRETNKYIRIPANSYVQWWDNWSCEWWFERRWESCVKVYVPSNAYLNDAWTDWICNRWYKKQSNSCVKIYLPPNSRLNEAWNDWTCIANYVKIYNRCERINY